WAARSGGSEAGGWTLWLEAGAGFGRAHQGDVVRVLEVAAGRQAEAEPRHLEPVRDELADALVEIPGRALPLLARVRRQHDLLRRLAVQPLQQRLDFEVVRPDPLERVDRAVQDVVEPLVAGGPLDRQDVERLLDDADRAAVAARVGADAARVRLRDVEALGAEDDPLLDVDDRLGQAACRLGRLPQQEE